MLPVQHVRAKTFVGKSFDRIYQSVLGDFEVYEKRFGIGAIFSCDYFVWMMNRSSGQGVSIFRMGFSPSKWVELTVS